MMTNPTAVLYDDDGDVRAVGTWEEVHSYVSGYADAMIDHSLDELEAEAARAQAFSDYYLSSQPIRVVVDTTGWDDDEFLAGLDVPTEVSIGPVLDADIEPDEQDLAEAYADLRWDAYIDHASPSTEYGNLVDCD